MRRLEKFRQAIVQSKSMIIITDSAGRTEYINDRLTETLGFTLDELKGKFHIFATKDEKGANMQKQVEHDLFTKGYFAGEMDLEAKDGRIIWTRVTIAPVIRKKKPEFFVGVFDDITEENELRSLNRKNQERFNTIMDNIPVSISLMDIDGKFIFFNRQAEKNLRAPGGKLQNKSISDIYPVEGREALEQVQMVFSTGKPVNAEISYNISGRINFFDVSRVPLFDNDNNVSSVMSIALDITEKKQWDKLGKILQAVDSLQSVGETVEQSMEVLFDNLFRLDWLDGGGIYLADYENKVLQLIYHRGLSERMASQISTVHFNNTSEYIIDTKIPRYLSTGSFPGFASDLIIDEKIKFLALLPLVYKDHAVGLLNLASRKVDTIEEIDRNAIESIAQKVANLIVLVRTRTELNQSNAELNDKLRQLSINQQLLVQKSRLESLGELSAGLAHEINQPLSVISLAMENVNYKLEKNGTTKEYLSQKFQTITHNINKIRDLIEHVRLFSRDQGEVLFEPVDVNLVIRNALSMIESQLRHHRIQVKTELSEGIGFTTGNPSRFEQVILNLLSNARDALGEKETKNKGTFSEKVILIKTKAVEGRINVSVRDNGTGITQANLDNIFNPFFTTKISSHGTGLGLAIVYGIIREMNGEIVASSEEGVYTELSILLPERKE